MSLGIVGKKYSNYYALLHFYEEAKYSIMKIKDCIPSGMEIGDSLDLNDFEFRKIINVKWDNGHSYPARILQFGEDKKVMDETVDGLIFTRIQPNDIPRIQVSQKLSEKRGKEKENLSSEKRHSMLSKKKQQTTLFKELREKMDEKKACDRCLNLQAALKDKNFEIEQMQKELVSNEIAFNNLKRKYDEKKKEKCKAQKAKLKSLSIDQIETVKFGLIPIPVTKLSLCRATDVSKYTGDLLEICFGRDHLAESVLKGSASRSKKTSVLDTDVINDIIAHVLTKFTSATVGVVKAALRQKLNTCHKSKLKLKQMNQ